MKRERVAADVRWVCGSYDGPTCGIAQYDGRMHWFQMLGSPHHFHGMRAYALHPLTRWEAFREWLAHVVMVALVGNAETRDADGNRIGRAAKRRNRRWLWVATLRIADRLHSWPRRRWDQCKQYEKRASPGYFMFRCYAERGNWHRRGK